MTLDDKIGLSEARILRIAREIGETRDEARRTSSRSLFAKVLRDKERLIAEQDNLRVLRLVATGLRGRMHP